jgi:hypothetical protein
MHSSNPQTSQQSLETTSDTNNNNLERLKQQQQSSQHLNGNIHNNNLISTSTQTNHTQLNIQNFTNSQKEVLRVIGQHLQSVGLRY